MRFRAICPKIQLFLFQKLPAAGNQDWIFGRFSLIILCISCPSANRRRVCIHLQLHLFLFAYTNDVPHKHPYAIVCRYSTLCAVNMLYPTCFPITWTTTAVGISKIWSSLAITPSWRMKNTHFEKSDQISFAIFSLASGRNDSRKYDKVPMVLDQSSGILGGCSSPDPHMFGDGNPNSSLKPPCLCTLLLIDAQKSADSSASKSQLFGESIPSRYSSATAVLPQWRSLPRRVHPLGSWWWTLDWSLVYPKRTAMLMN